MNRKAREMDLGQIIILILFIPFFIALIFEIGNLATPHNCPTCDCSTYQNQFISCNETVNNLTKQIEETPIKYIQNVTEVPVEKIVYREKPISIGLNVLALILSFGITFSLFKIEIKLPKELEDKIIKIEKIILWIKWVSVALSFVLLVKLVIIIFS